MRYRRLGLLWHGHLQAGRGFRYPALGATKEDYRFGADGYPVTHWTRCRSQGTVTGQLFLVVAVGKIISSMPGAASDPAPNVAARPVPRFARPSAHAFQFHPDQFGRDALIELRKQINMMADTKPGSDRAGNMSFPRSQLTR